MPSRDTCCHTKYCPDPECEMHWYANAIREAAANGQSLYQYLYFPDTYNANPSQSH